jgi:hypothetical protein
MLNYNFTCHVVKASHLISQPEGKAQIEGVGEQINHDNILTYGK